MYYLINVDRLDFHHITCIHVHVHVTIVFYLLLQLLARLFRTYLEQKKFVEGKELLDQAVKDVLIAGADQRAVQAVERMMEILEK